jgi:hypothetical protein
LVEFIGPYNGHRSHRALDQQPPFESGVTSPLLIGHPDPTRLRRTDKLGSLIHEYRLVA